MRLTAYIVTAVIVVQFVYSQEFPSLSSVDVSATVSKVDEQLFFTYSYTIFNPSDNTASLWIFRIDISTPSNPQLISTFSNLEAAIDVAVVGNIAYVTDATLGLSVIDITDPQAPILVTTVSATNLQKIEIKGNAIYVSDSDSGLHAFDISNPRSPVLVATLATSGSAFGLSVMGWHVFIGDGQAGLAVIDISSSKYLQPQLMGSLNGFGTVYDVDVVNNSAYVTDSSGLKIVDITTPSAPSLVGSYKTRGTALGVTVAGNKAYVADGTLGLKIIDITNMWKY